MAQAVFDEHPLEQYLRNAGEAQDLMPGSTIELESELDPWWATELVAGEEEDEGVEWRPLFMIQAIEVIMAMISELGLPPPSHSSPFVEHFKYDVISSSLLAVSLPLTHPRTPRSPVPTIPGQLNHSRTSSLSNTHTPTSLPAAPTDSSYLIPSLSLIAFAVFIHAGSIPLALASFGITVYTFNAHDTQKHDMSPCLETLDELIASSNEWEAVVQTAISVVDSDEQSFSFGPATPQSPSSSLRVALHSSLLTTQTQCDNVRQLFAALTLPSELSQLSEMYAPPSPMASSSFSQDSHTRPLSLPSRRRTLSMPSNPLMSPESKRQTWTGSYSRLNQLGSPGFKVQRKRRSDLTSLLQASPSPTFMTASAPVTPATSSLPYVSEESDSEYEDAHEQLPNTADGSMTFGSAALALHRKRRTVGMEAFRLPPPSYFSPVSSPRLTPQSPRTPPRPSSTYVSGSRLTPVQAGRHPLSLSALHHALQNALASKRFACSHLLALRFADEEDDGYWEDVRSVMGLLTTTLSDASSRLSEAITEVEQQKLRDQNPTPLSNEFPASEEYDVSMDVDSSVGASSPLPSRWQTSISFAPLPSHLSRFAVHVEAITSALNDAREDLQQCVLALREETRDPDNVALDRPRHRRSRNMSTSSSADEPHAAATPPALEAYERLRRELGLALRECERGRARLLDVVYPPDLYTAEDDGDSGDDVPALGHDGSDESDKPDPVFPFDMDVEPESPPVGYAVVALEAVDGGAMDDATSHLLLSASTQHLPPPGIEQVFEADSGSVGMFTRERSKLTREERIKLAKARRESGGAALGLEPAMPVMEAKKGAGVEKWGPGGEVVQELKDVIWKVGERRRQMADANSSLFPSAARSAEPVKLDEASI